MIVSLTSNNYTNISRDLANIICNSHCEQAEKVRLILVYKDTLSEPLFGGYQVSSWFFFNKNNNEENSSYDKLPIIKSSIFDYNSLILYHQNYLLFPIFYLFILFLFLFLYLYLSFSWWSWCCSVSWSIRWTW